jgi:hypothetical protein
MTTQIELEGFEGQMIEVKPPGFLSAAKLLLNGQNAPKGPKRGQMLLHKNDGTEVIASWQPSMMGLDMPKLVVDGDVIEIVKPLEWYEMVWGALPILLVFLGGLLGAVAGIIGFSINTKVFRSELNTAVKFLITGAVSLGAGIVYLVLVTLLTLMIGG